MKIVNNYLIIIILKTILKNIIHDQIKDFCETNFGITFPMTEKISVRGSNQHQLYKWLTSKDFNGRKSSSVKWNFQKYLVDKDGYLIDYWYSLTSPMSSKITNYIK